VKELVSIASVGDWQPTDNWVSCAQTAISTILAAATAKQSVGVFESGGGDSESVYPLLNKFRDLAGPCLPNFWSRRHPEKQHTRCVKKQGRTWGSGCAAIAVSSKSKP